MQLLMASCSKTLENHIFGRVLRRLKFPVAILNERSDPSQSSNDAPHRLPSTLRATGHEPPQFGLSLPKHDAEPSEQPLCHYKGALSGLGPRDGLALRWSAATT